MAVAVLTLGLALALARIPKSVRSREKIIYALGVILFAGLVLWVFRLEQSVLAAGYLPSTYDTIAVQIKGTIRYVPPELAYRHEASIFLFLLFVLAYFGVVEKASRDNEA
jgi:hypothetical protein